MNTITWLHLSDLHYKKEDEYNRQVVLAALWEDIEKRTTRISPDLENIDFILFTGDVAYHGESIEYKLAVKNFFKPLLKAANLDSEDNSRLFIVPGNHDIKREPVTSWRRKIRELLKERDEITDFLADSDGRKIVFGRLDDYFTLFRCRFPHLTLNDLGYFYVAEIPLISGKKVAILGLNSSWLSYGGKEDRGKLTIGERQVKEALKDAENGSICLALVHHPFDWLQDNDDTEGVKHLLRKHCHFILHGHLHRPNVISESRLASETIIIPAGAVYDKRESPNNYNFVRLDLETGKGIVYIGSFEVSNY